MKEIFIGTAKACLYMGALIGVYWALNGFKTLSQIDTIGVMAVGIKPFKDGNQWSFLYGENIQDGICGFGDTIDRAAWDFYTNLKSEKL